MRFCLYHLLYVYFLVARFNLVVKSGDIYKTLINNHVHLYLEMPNYDLLKIVDINLHRYYSFTPYTSGSQPMGHDPNFCYWVFCLDHELISKNIYLYIYYSLYYSFMNNV